MPIVVDPDNLDRNQVIFATQNQKISIYPVGALVNAAASSQSAQTSAANAKTFYDANASFTDWGVAADDIISLKNGPEARHVRVSAVTNPSVLVVKTSAGFAGFTDASGLVYTIHDPTGGSVTSGVTEQAVYSYSKEEWRVDVLATALNDNLIRHEQPFEPITRESMEIGGGAAHGDWNWVDDYTRKKIRTGGWASRNSGATASAEYAGIISLGNIESGSQPYYQQVSAQNAPVDFTFTGPINEAILIYSSATQDFRSFLQIFLRTKAQTYAKATLADIGVTQLETIVNRFPLAEAADAAIVDDDARVKNYRPFHTIVTAVRASAARASAISSTVGKLQADSGTPYGASTVFVGDVLFITGTQANAGYYEITSVVAGSAIQVDTTENGIWTTDATPVDYRIGSRVRSAVKAGNRASAVGDGAFAVGASAAVARFSSASPHVDFTADSVAANDVLRIVSATSDHEGVYTIVSVINASTLQVDTTDNPATAVSGIDFLVETPSMYLQYKKEDVTITATGSVSFASATGQIVRDTGTWTADGVTEGTVMVFASTSNNDRSYTVATVTNASTIVTVSADWSRIRNETTTGASTTAYDAFKRSISGVVYAFNWRLLANGNSLGNCYQFTQHQMRQSTDINPGEATFRGDVTDQLLTFATPTGTTTNMIIDNIDADDTNNATYEDATGQDRVFPFVSSMTITFNANLQNDASAIYRMFFTSVPDGDYSTADAVTVQDDTGSDIAGNVSGSPNVQKTFDYDGNVQGGRTAGTDAAITLVAIGLNTAQFAITTGTITRSKGLTFALQAALERNYSNP